MQISVIAPVLISLVFGLVVAAIELLIAGGIAALTARAWLSRAWVYLCFCYIILFGIIKV